VKGGFIFVTCEIRVWKWHLKVSEGSENKELSYGCQICNNDQVYFGFKPLVNHLRNDHTKEQLKRQGLILIWKETGFWEECDKILSSI
jgi:hypothetical protein